MVINGPIKKSMQRERGGDKEEKKKKYEINGMVTKSNQN